MRDNRKLMIADVESLTNVLKQEHEVARADHKFGWLQMPSRTIEDVNLVQAVAQISGMAIEMSRQYKGLKGSIEILKARRDPRSLKSKKWTPYEGVPESQGAIGKDSRHAP